MDKADVSFAPDTHREVGHSGLRRSKRGALGAILTYSIRDLVALSASPAFAISSNNPALTGGGSTGYNRLTQTFRLKHHPAKSQTQHHQAPESDIK